MSGLKLSGVLAVVTPENCRMPIPAAAGGVEVRADLFDSREESLELIASISKTRPVLVTPRHSSQGGGWRGSELERAAYCLEAFDRGASLADVEHGSEAAGQLLGSGKPVLLSWHDFDGMIAPEALDRLTLDMEACGPAAIKVVPTAGRLGDAVRMLEWVAQRPAAGASRIGFAMGAAGGPSRILSLSRGAPWTYGAHGLGVAPGQLPVQQLADLYRVDQLDLETRVYGVAGNPVKHSLSPQMHNPALRAAGLNAVYVPIYLSEFSELEECWESLGLDGLSVTIPFKLDALALASVVDERASNSGAANTLVRVASENGWALHGYNTDFNGVLDPLERRLGSLADLDAAILGNGGAARGAARALLEVGARPTIYYRSKERGGAVAEELGVSSGLLGELGAGNLHRVIINATPLGLKADDPSPVPGEVFDSDTIAFDMVYDPPETRFIQDARSKGAEVIRGDEMLVAQGLVQFELFTGQKASRQAFDSSLQAARSTRSP